MNTFSRVGDVERRRRRIDSMRIAGGISRLELLAGALGFSRGSRFVHGRVSGYRRRVRAAVGKAFV